MALFRWDNPAASDLFLAGSDMLTVSDIISRLALEGVGSVVLSACETGIVDIRSIPDEMVGLVAALLLAGAPFAAGTLWSVLDATTALYGEALRADAQRR
jgi:CHAT domain-containing protein